MKKLLMYTISQEYVDWLSSHEPNIMWAKAHKLFSRPYIGIVLEINNYFYFAPLTHKANKWIGYQDHFVISTYGSVCFNNMIPILKECMCDVVKFINFSQFNNAYNSKEWNYFKLLTKEWRFINKKQNLNSIHKTAWNVYKSWKNY